MPVRAPPVPRAGLLALLLPVAVGAATAVAFLPALDGGFLGWDDRANLVDNPHYRGLGWRHLHWMFTTTLMGHYTPLAWLSHGVDHALWGMNPRGYHLGNVALHAAGAAVLYVVARRLLAAGFAAAPARAGAAVSLGAAFAALVFGVHPLRVESVAWVTERQDVLCGLFYLLAVWAYLRGAERGGRILPGWWALSVGAFLLALLAKAAAMPLPAALLLLDVYPLRRVGAVGWRRLLVEKLPYLGLVALAAPIALIAQSHADALIGRAQYGIGARLAMTAYSFMFYPWKFLWWADLSPLYERPGRIDPMAARFLVPMAGVLVVTATLMRLRRRWPAGLAAWVYSALLVLPVSGMVPFGGHLVADRYSYLSGFGFALLAGAALTWVLRARATLGAPVVGASALAAVLIVVGLSAATWRQSKIWHDSETLWRWAHALDQDCEVCAVNLGAELIAAPGPGAARLGEAEALFRHVLALNPARDLAYHGLGTALTLQRRYDEAETAFREFVRRAPSRPEARIDLGQLHLLQRRHDEAIPLLRQALLMQPDYPGLARLLSRALHDRAEQLRGEGRDREAEALLTEAAALGSRAVPDAAR
jgi:hypothetical protein